MGNLDKLAEEGLPLRNHCANSPVSCPARAVILTGKYAHSNGMVANDLRLRESETSIAELFARAGYRTGFVGKWHLDGGPRQPGRIPPGERRQGFACWAANEVSHAHFDTHYFRDDPQPIPIRSFEPEAWADLGSEFLRRTHEDSRPFFLTVQMGPPHDPYVAPDEYMALHDPATIALRPNSAGDESDRDLEPNPYVATPGRKEVAAYYAMVSAVDAQIGRMLAQLDALGLRDNTIVILSSDHGDMLGSHGARLKRKPWDESIRVPGIVRPPRAPSGRATNALFSHVEIAPTLLSLCGREPDPAMRGSDLTALIRGESESGPESAYFQIFGPFEQASRGAWSTAGGVSRRAATCTHAHGVRRGCCTTSRRTHTNCRTSLAILPLRKSRRGWRRNWACWMRQSGDSWDYDWTAPIDDGGRLYKHETFYTVEEFLGWAAKHPERADL